MNSKFTFFQPKYVKKFHCDGQKCGAQCCKCWIIDIDKKTFDDYAKIESPNKEITSKIKFFDERQSYIALLDENYSCSFLMDDNLCWIQKNYGETNLSIICQSYPRSVSKIGDLYERILTLTCPLAAELALLPTELMEFEVVEETFKAGSKLRIQPFNIQPKILPYFVDIQATAIFILQERSLTIDQRLAILGFFLDRLDGVIKAKKFDEIVNLTEIYGSIKFIFQAVPTLLAKLNFYPKEFVEFMFGGVLESLYGKGTPVKEIDETILDAVKEIFKLTPDSNFSISIDTVAKNLTALKNLRGDFLKKYNHIFENYLVNEFFMALQPFRLKYSIQRNYAVFVTTYKIIELFTFALAQKFPKTNESNLVNLISVMATSFDHTPPYIERIAADFEGRDKVLEIISTLLQT